MNFICLQENLKQGLNIVERIIGKNLTLPILNTVLIEAKKNFIKLSATDLEIGLSCWLTGKIEKEGSVCVPVKILSNYINSLPNKKVEINLRNNKLSLKCENYTADFSIFNSEDFPIIPEIKEKEFIYFNSFKFCQNLSKVIGAVALSNTRPEISGVFINFKRDLIKLVATDSFRLAESTLFLEKSLELEKAIIVPAKTIQEVIRIFGQNPGNEIDLKISLSPNQILFDKENQKEISPIKKIQLISRLIEGDYPDYEDIIPKDFLTRIIVDKDEMMRHIKIASFFATRVNDIKIKVDPLQKIIYFSSSDPNIGENKSKMIGKIEGEKIEITFNWKYLLDGLVNITENQVIFELNGEMKPGILKPSDKDKKDYLYIVMPIRV